MEVDQEGRRLVLYIEPESLKLSLATGQMKFGSIFITIGGRVKVSNFGAELRSFLAAIFTVGTMSGFYQLAHAVFFSNC